MDYDVFICYRHDGLNEKDRNVSTAKLIKRELERQFAGCRVFLDQHQCSDWRFQDVILPAIRSCRNFVVMLTDGSLDRCKDEEDWVRREILEAFISPCKVILISADGEMNELPKDMPRELAALEGVEITEIGVKRKSFELEMALLIRRLVVSDNESGGSPKGKVLHIETDYDCLVKSFGRDLIHATVGGDNCIVLPEGRHKMRFVAEGYDGIFEEEVVDTDKLRPHDFIEVKLKDRVTEYRKEKEEYFVVGGVKFRMVRVEGGRFEMGATAEQGDDVFDDEKPAHWVELDGYRIGETVVTQELWMAVMGEEPTENGGWTDKRGRGATYPAYNVSYDDIVTDFLPELKKRLKEERGIDYDFRLPTEAEWEYAARGGHKKGKRLKYSGSDKIGEVAWYDKNSGWKTHPVKEKGKVANELGLYGMSGNVWEWCEDWYGKDYYSKSPISNPKGPVKGSYRVLRGGSWYVGAESCRVSNRFNLTPDFCYDSYGFRLVLCP